MCIIQSYKSGGTYEKIQNNPELIIKLSSERFKIFADNYGEYISYFQKKGNINFNRKFKALIKNNVYKYFNYNIKNEEEKEFLYEFMFTSIISSFVYWYNNPKMMSFESYIVMINNMALNGGKIIIEYMNK